mgnify:CR=1 FL=1
MNYLGGNVTFSSRANASNQYEQEIQLAAAMGEDATLEYSGPLHDTQCTAWRENGERKFKLEAHEPYFFIEDNEFEFENYTVNKYISRSFTYEKGDWVSLQGKSLKKVIVEQATDIYKARNK